MMELSSNPNIYLRYKPYIEILTKNYQISDIESFINLFRLSIISGALTPENAEDLRETIYGKLNDKHDEINDFNKATKSLKREIHEELSSKKR